MFVLQPQSLCAGSRLWKQWRITEQSDPFWHNEEIQGLVFSYWCCRRAARIQPVVQLAGAILFQTDWKRWYGGNRSGRHAATTGAAESFLKYPMRRFLFFCPMPRHQKLRPPAPNVRTHFSHSPRVCPPSLWNQPCHLKQLQRVTTVWFARSKDSERRVVIVPPHQLRLTWSNGVDTCCHFSLNSFYGSQ